MSWLEEFGKATRQSVLDRILDFGVDGFHDMIFGYLDSSGNQDLLSGLQHSTAPLSKMTLKGALT